MKILHQSIIQDGENEYEIRLHYIGDKVPNTPIILCMEQHTYNGFNSSGYVYGATWKAKENSIYPVDKNMCYKDIWYAPRETALIYYMSLTGSNNSQIKALVTKFIQGSINVGLYVLDLKGLAEDVIDYAVNGFTDIVSKYDPITSGFSKGLWKASKDRYDYYGLIIDPVSFVVSKLKEKLNIVLNQLVNLIHYKEVVGETIQIDSITNSFGDKFIFCEYGLIDCTRVDGEYECERWEDFTRIYGENGVKGDFE
ncbi:MAG: hypothetical protein Q4F88_03625 [Eubacteriales bacterium]|nr:hypothetical protein [Eubacteriales bacterium]